MRENKIYKKLMTLNNIRYGLIFSIIGLILYILANIENLLQNRWGEVLIVITIELAGAFFATGLISLYWDLKGKRSYTNELFEKFGLSQSIEGSKVKEILIDFQKLEKKWEDYFENTDEIDLFFTYANTYRNNHRQKFLTLADTNKITVRVILPNPENKRLISNLAFRFQKSVPELKKSIKEAIRDFLTLRDKLISKESNLSLWLTNKSPLFTMHRYDKVGIIALYNHRLGRLPVPTIICEKGGSLYNYLVDEFSDLLRAPETSEIDYNSFPRD